MKKQITIASAAALAFLCSCADFLETAPTNAISTNTMWSSEEKADAGMAGLYYPLYKSDLSRTQLRMEDYDGLNRMGIEGIGFTSDENTTNYLLTYLSQSAKSSSDFQVRIEWKTLYTIVHACNDAIAHLHRAGMSEEKTERYLCEARLLRAWTYSRLNMLYGGVPLYLEPVTNDQCNRTQSTFTEVWQAVIDDCTYAIDNESCPRNTLSTHYGRPSKGLAYALRGMAYMWLAADKEPVIDPAAAPLSTDAIRAYYEAAEQDFAAVEECGYGLWTGRWGDLFCEANERNREMIFPLQFTSAVGYCHNWQQVIGATHQYIGWGNLKPSADFVDSFQNADGTPFSWEAVSGFEDWNALTPRQREVYFLRDGLNDLEADIADLDSRIAAAEAQEEKDRLTEQKRLKVLLQTNRNEAQKRIGTDVYNSYYLNSGNEARVRSAYDGRDPRLAQAVITPYEEVSNFNPYSDPQVVHTVVMRWPLTDQDNNSDGADLWAYHRNSMFYIWKKYNVLDDSLPGGVNGRQRCGYDWPLVRFTHILLQRAEALAYLGRLDEARAQVDRVRSRAGMPNVAAASTDELLEAIRYEARVELCEEGVNFFDEIRWGTYRQSKFQGEDTNSGKTVWGDGSLEYKWFYTDTMWPWSISDWEAQKNPALKRREGWLY